MTTREIGDVCGDDWLPGNAPPAVALHLPLRVFVNRDNDQEEVVQGHWNLPAESWLKLTADGRGFVQSTEGVVTLVPCGADIKYQICPNSEEIDLSNGSSLDINPSTGDGVVFSIPADVAYIAIIAPVNMPASVVLEGRVTLDTKESFEIHTSNGKPWHYPNPEDPNIECGIFRCP